METKEVFNHSILKINQNGLLSSNKHELNTTLKILRNDTEQFPMEKGKLQISENNINECIKKHHNESLQSHLGVSKMLQLLQHYCQFPGMR